MVVVVVGHQPEIDLFAVLTVSDVISLLNFLEDGGYCHLLIARVGL